MKRLLAALALLPLVACEKEITISKQKTFVLNSGFPVTDGNCTKIFDIALDKTNGRLFVHGIITSEIAVIDLDTGKLCGYVDSGIDGYHISYIAANPATGRLYVADQKSKKAIKIDVDANHVSESSVSFDSEPSRIAVRSGQRGTGYVIVSFTSQNKVRVYDVDLNHVKTFDVDDGMWGPKGMHIQEDTLYVALGRGQRDQYGDDVSSSETKSGIAVIDLASLSVTARYTFQYRGAEEVSHDKDTGRYYLVNSGRFWCVSSSGSLVKTLTSGGIEFREVEYYERKALVLTRDGKTSTDGTPFGSVRVYDPTTGTLEKEYTVGPKPSRMAIWRDGRKLYTANMASSTVSIVDLEQRIVLKGTKEQVGNCVGGLRLNDSGSKIYVQSRLGNSRVYRYDVSSGDRESLDVGGWPTGMEYDQGSDELMVANHFNGTVDFFSGTAKVASVDHGYKSTTHDLSTSAFDDPQNRLFVAVPEHGVVVVIATGRREVDHVITGFPQADEDESGDNAGKIQLAADSSRHELWVYSVDDQRLRVYDSSYSCIKNIDVSSRTLTGYTSSALQCIPSLGRVFLGPYAYATSSKSYVDRLGAGHVVVAYDSGYGYLVTATADDGTLSLHLCDPDSLASKGTKELTTYTFAPPVLEADPDNNRLYVGLQAEAKVLKYSYEIE